MKQTEYLIVGSGIAGISLAWELYQRQLPFVIISKPNMSSSSLIAPALWNPIVFKRILPVWNATTLIDTLIPFYHQVENYLQHKLIEHLKLYHVIHNDNEKKLWYEKKEFYPRFLGDIHTITTQQYIHLKRNIECGEVLLAGRVRVAEYIYRSIEFFKSIDVFNENFFNYNELKYHGQYVSHAYIKAKKVIFCEGHLISNNPYFKFVKLKPAKGELIEIQTTEPILPSHIILHHHFNIIPTYSNKYIIGSNYEWEQLNEVPTDSVKDKFLKSFDELFDVSYKLIRHYAGIRPAADRRPILGAHPQYPFMYVMNGMGTRGVMLAPYCAKLLVDELLYQHPIDAELHVNRFLKNE